MQFAQIGIHVFVQKIEILGVDFPSGLWYNNAARLARGRAANKVGLCPQNSTAQNLEEYRKIQRRGRDNKELWREVLENA